MGFVPLMQGEIPGLISALVLVDRLGRRRSMALYFAIAVVSLVPLGIDVMPDWAGTMCMFFARMAMCACFSTVYVYTPEVCGPRIPLAELPIVFGCGVSLIASWVRKLLS